MLSDKNRNFQELAKTSEEVIKTKAKLKVNRSFFILTALNQRFMFCLIHHNHIPLRQNCQPFLEKFQEFFDLSLIRTTQHSGKTRGNTAKVDANFVNKILD